MASDPAKRTYLGHDERRAQILSEAARLFSERHYEAVSTAQIARASGVARGLLHHYFGTKRELYIEVLRWMLRVPDDLLADASPTGATREQALSDAVDRWLRMVRRNRGTWLATIGAQGFGRDPEVEAVLEEARERIAEQIIAIVWSPSAPASAPTELRAIVHGYAGFAQTVTADWLLRPLLTRAQVHELLLQTLLALVSDVLPRVQSARTRPRSRGRATTNNRRKAA